MAGLPSAFSDLLNDDVLTCLRRATREDLRDVALDDVRETMAQTIADYGRTITDTALTAAAVATGGYPFMIQLVGYHCWRKADGDVIDEAAVTGHPGCPQTTRFDRPPGSAGRPLPRGPHLTAGDGPRPGSISSA